MDKKLIKQVCVSSEGAMNNALHDIEITYHLAYSIPILRNQNE